MKLLVVGSVALDTVQTPFGHEHDVLGGSACYFSVASSVFTKPRLVGVVGEDFPEDHVRLLKSRDVDTSGLEVARGKTFRWSGKYEGNMMSAQTLEVQLNVFGEFDPKLPDSYADSDLIFLANGHPALQERVRASYPKAKFTLADTMNLWIETARPDLDKLIGRVDAMILNDGEARELTGQQNLFDAGRAVLNHGPRYVIIKKGEHGAILMSREGERFVIPAMPLDTVKDPTGAGDSFAGGLMGYLATRDSVTFEDLKIGMICGNLVASFVVEQFSLGGTASLTKEKLGKRLAEYRKIVGIPTIPTLEA
jgi:sugar/nucleoside kinase (ribokinase family)